MSDDIHFVTDQATFATAVKSLAAGCFLDRYLPQQVFKHGYGDFKFVEFDRMLSPSFWKTLQALSGFSDDSCVLITMLEPDPKDYYFKEFGRFGLIQLDCSEGEEAYYDALWSAPKGSSADAVVHISNALAWHSASLNWIFWGQRSFGVGVLARRLATGVPLDQISSDSGLTTFSLVDAMTSLVALNFPNQKIPQKFSKTLLENYSSKE